MLFKVAFGKEIHVLNPKNQTTLVQIKEFIRAVFKKIPEKYMLTYVDAQGDQIALGNQNDVQILQETGQKSVKIYIEETNEDFFEQTDQIVLESNEKQSTEIKLQEIKSQSQKCSSAQLSESSISQVSILDYSIDEKLRKMMPSIIQQIKAQLTKESSVSLPKVQKIPLQEDAIHYGVRCDGCTAYPIVGVRYKCAVRPNFDLCEVCQANRIEQYPFLKIKSSKQAPYKILCILKDNNNSMEINGERFEISEESILSEMFNADYGFGFESTKPRRRQWKQARKERNPQRMSKKCQRKFYKQKKEDIIQSFGEIPDKIEFPKFQIPIVEVPDKNDLPIKVQPLSQQKKEQPIVAEEERILEAANYLANVLQYDFKKCYNFACTKPLFNKEQLLQEYFARGGRM